MVSTREKVVAIVFNGSAVAVISGMTHPRECEVRLGVKIYGGRRFQKRANRYHRHTKEIRCRVSPRAGDLFG